MGIFSSSTLSLLAVVLLSLLWRQPSDLVYQTFFQNIFNNYEPNNFSISNGFFSHPKDQNPFFQCLINHSQDEPHHPPVSEAIFTPQDDSYSNVLQSYIRNLRFNTTSTPKPLLILAALHESHVQAAVTCARKHALQIKVRSGGHDYEGRSYVSDVPFFLLDMFNLRAIDIDMESETAWVQAGATLGEVYYRVNERSKTHGFPAGVCPTVGVGGHFGSGGYGNMMRKYGLSVDNVVDARMVDVNGRLLDRKSMGEDLFWAIRGGGSSSFGVVTSYKINMVHVPETVTVFRVEKTLEQNATHIVYRWQHVAHKLDRDLYIRLILDVVNGTQNGDKTVRATFIALFLGFAERLVSIMDDNFRELGLSRFHCIEMSWPESVLFWANFPLGTPTTALLDRTQPTMVFLKRKSDYVKETISKEGLESIWKKMIELETPWMGFNPYGGKMADIPATEIPFPHRAGNLWKIQYGANWNEAGTEAENYYIDKTRKLHSFMTPFVSKNPRQSFMCYRDLDLGIHQNGKASYSQGRAFGIRYFNGNFDRLVQIKTKVDPHNFFKDEQSIPILDID